MHKELYDDSDLSTAEKRTLAARLLRARSALARRAQGCLHRLFEAHAALDPDAVALTRDDRHWTYGELNARANRLARRLRALGVSAEVPVGIYADRSFGMIVGILAVLKAGGAYVPLDTAYPADRLAFLLADSRVPVLLCPSGLADGLPPHDAAVIDLDDECLDEREDDLTGGAPPDNAAYIIYTSGSTGRPKGVVVTHANVTQLLTSTQPSFGFGPHDVWTLFHSFAFDFSVWEVWGALTFGGRLVVVPYWVSRSPEAFLSLLRSERVTVLNQTPSAFRQLIRADEAAPASAADELGLRLVIFGGEALELETLRPWFDRHGDATPQLVNMYGITETTVHVTYRPISSGDLDAAAGTSPIGVPIPGWKVVLLDRNMQPVPAGVVGEICVGGKGLARGYLGRAALTAERFVPDPFSADPGARLYRSGDLARRRADGALEYLGRSDHQVKVRGFRIELGEIETALARHPAVRESVVLAREFAPGDRRLVAYVVGRRPGSPAASELRDWLRPRLPEYMVPSAFVPLDALPLTHHGKVDRDALPAPDVSALSSTNGVYEAPRTPVELAVAGAWAEVLGVERVGLADNFFDLGGHSLLATQVVSRVRDALGVDVPLRSLFETPTVAALAKEAERAIRSGLSAVPVLAPRARVKAVPASFAQQRLWFLDQLEPGRPWYNIPAVVRLRGLLDVEALGRAFAEVVRRHEVLRTTFAEVDGAPVQVIGPAQESFPLTLIDAEESDALRRARDESWRPFDLARGPLFRVALFRVSAEDHVIAVTTHHVVSDGWSVGVLVRELAALYSAFARGEPSPLPPLPVQYADFSGWQREWLEGGALESQLDALKSTLAGVPNLELPTDRPRPASPGGRGGVRDRTYSGALADALRETARRENATLFMALLAGFEALLHRYSGQADFAVGSPVAGRTGSRTEGLIGFFVNTLVIRADLSGGPSFVDLVRRCREAALGAYALQDVPFEQLVVALDPKRDPSRTPLFQVMFALQNAPSGAIQVPGLTVQPVDVGSVSAKFDLSLSVVETDDGLKATLEYSAELFDAATADRMLDHLGALLAAAVESPDSPVADLPILTGPERDDLDRWNDTAAEISPSCVHQLFEAQARRSPDAVAVGFEGATLTYRELNARSNRLARHLRRLGVEPGVLASVCVERGPEMVVALLGVLKAGGAYLPLDPDFPPSRLALMLEQSRAPFLVTQKALRDRLAADEATVICLDDDDAIQEQNDGDIDSPATLDDLAYVIYTSGSTGLPKGVMVPHVALTNFLESMARKPGLTESDTLLAVTTLSFDIAALELFLPLTVGARVEIVSREVAVDGARLSEALGSTGATVLQATPATWEMLLASGWEGSPSLTILCGGEALTRDLSRRLLAKGKAVWNLYGPTETTVWSTLAKVEPVAGPVPVGRPIANTRAYVLDARRNRVPVGVTGELYLAGAGLARGYLDRPELTADRFPPDPFSADPGARMYRTGDLARFRPDGVVECLGRTDGQVKIRGYRVELGDVESALAAHPAVKAAAALAVPDPAGFLRLVGYLVPLDADAPPDASELRAWLKERRPDYMVPSAFVVLDALPMTPNGKIDRKSLPSPDAATPAALEPAIAPRDEVETRLARAWEEVLDVRPVGVNQSFFDLGGHSLLAIRLLGRIEEDFGRRLPLAALFRGPTVEELAHVLRAEAAKSVEGPWTPLVAIRPGTDRDKPPFFCVHPAGGIVYCFQDLARQLGDDRPFYALQAAGLEGDQPPFLVFEEMAARYVQAIREVRPEGPYHLGGWSLGGVIAFEMARQLVEAGHEVGSVSLFDSRAPGPVVDREVADAQRALAEEVAALALFENGDLVGSTEELAFVLGQFPPEIVEEFGGDARRLTAHLRELPPDARRAFVLRAFQLDLVYHMETGPEQVERLWSVLRANLVAGSKYDPRPYSGRVILFRAGDAKDAAETDPHNGWDALVTGGVTVRTVPGDHTTILRGPNLRTLADGLRSVLDGEVSS